MSRKKRSSSAFEKGLDIYTSVLGKERKYIVLRIAALFPLK